MRHSPIRSSLLGVITTLVMRRMTLEANRITLNDATESGHTAELKFDYCLFRGEKNLYFLYRLKTEIMFQIDRFWRGKSNFLSRSFSFSPFRWKMNAVLNREKTSKNHKISNYNDTVIVSLSVINELQFLGYRWMKTFRRMFWTFAMRIDCHVSTDQISARDY